jgi:hypothetical protein
MNASRGPPPPVQPRTSSLLPPPNSGDGGLTVSRPPAEAGPAVTDCDNGSAKEDKLVSPAGGERSSEGNRGFEPEGEVYIFYFCNKFILINFSKLNKFNKF